MNKGKLIFLCITMAGSTVMAADEFDIRWISDQHVLGVNKEDTHATFIPYATSGALFADARFNTPWLDPTDAMFISLNGTWKFKYVPGTPEGPGRSEFQAAELDDSAWDDIRVPMNWEMTGRYNLPTYTNVGYPHVNDAPNAMTGLVEHGVTDDNATGFYRRNFDIPDGWNGKRIFLHFDGVYSCCAVWVNGKFAGYSQGSNTGAEFDVTRLVTQGKNQLSVRVYRWCDGSYLEGQDMWRMSGIHRDVYLYATPKVHIQDHYITVSGQSEDATSGRLNVDLHIDNRDKAVCRKEIQMQVLDARRNVIASASQKVKLEGRNADIRLSTELLHGLTPWHTENPYLYTIVISQKSDGREEMAFATKYGFRNVQLHDSEDGKYFTINGKRIFFKGTNTHDTHPLYGRYLDAETMMTDLTLMKRANINTVRTSHYPRQPKMYAMCDALGLYVIDEADLECHADQSLTRNPEWTEAFVDRDVRMVMRDRNHPSIIFWSLGNENDRGMNMYRCYDAVRRLDSRFIHCHGEDASDMASEMYSPVRDVQKYSDGLKNKPFFLCEYDHAMGQSLGNLKEYWDIIESSSSVIGGCIWDWVDQSVYDVNRIREGAPLTDANGFHYFVGGCDYDPWFKTSASCDKGFQGNFLNNGIITADRRPTAKLAEVKKVYQFVEFTLLPDKELQIKNKYPFTDLGDMFYLEYSVLRNGVPVEYGTGEVGLPALQTGKFNVPYTTEITSDAEYALNVGLCLKDGKDWAPKGYRLADEQFVLNERPSLPAVEAKGSLKVKGNQVTGKNFTVTFDENGALCSYVFEGRELVAAAPEYNDFRRIDNDAYGYQFMDGDAYWAEGYDYADNAISSHSIDKRLSRKHNKAYLSMSAKGGKTDYAVDYTVYADGTLDMKVTFTPQRRGLRRLGLGMQFAPGFDEVEYYAKGPLSNYTDRQTGSYLGRYNCRIMDLTDRESHPQTNGDHQALRDMTLKNESSGIDLHITAEGPVAFSLSHFDELEWNHNTQYNELHWTDLVVHPQVFAHFDYWQRGIGNFSCGGDPCLPQYECPYPGNYQGAETLTYTLRFTPRLR